MVTEVLRRVDTHDPTISYGMSPRKSEQGFYGLALQVPAIQDVYLRFKHDSEYRSLRDELALIRAALVFYLEIGTEIYRLNTVTINAEPNLQKRQQLIHLNQQRMATHFAGMRQYIAVIATLVTSMAEIETDGGSAINVEQLVIVLSQVVNILETEIGDADQLLRIAGKLSTVAWPNATQQVKPSLLSDRIVGQASVLDDIAVKPEYINASKG